MRAASLAIVGLVFLAGCTAEAPAASPQAILPPAQVDSEEGTSAILGIVTDPEIQPLDAAAIRIFHRDNVSGASLTLSTNTSGRFAATGLPEGRYILYAARLGYVEAPPLLLDLAPDEQKEVNIVLQPQVVFEPFRESLRFGLQFHEQICYIVSGSPGCVTGYQTSNISLKYDATWEKKGELQNFLVESRWSPTIGTCSGGMRTDIYAPEAKSIPGAGYTEASAKAPPFHWDNIPETIKSPTYVNIPRHGEGLHPMLGPDRTAANDGKPINPSGNWSIRTYPYPVGVLSTPVDFSCLVNQSVELWLTGFFNGPAPKPDWTVFRDL